MTGQGNYHKKPKCIKKCVDLRFFFYKRGFKVWSLSTLGSFILFHSREGQGSKGQGTVGIQMQKIENYIVFISDVNKFSTIKDMTSCDVHGHHEFIKPIYRFQVPA